MPQRRLVDNGDLGSLHTMSITTSFSQKFHGPWRWVCVCAVMALTACGGGSASDEVPSTLGNVVGAWKDNTSARPTLAAIILPSGAYWAFYDTTGGSAGFAQGNASATGTNFRASTMEYPNGFDAYAVNVSAQMGSNRLTGTRSWSTGNNTGQQNFVLMPVLSSDFVAQQVQVGDLQGTWTGTLSGSSATLQFASNSNGAFSGSGGSSSCNFEGTLSPQANAYAFDVNLNFQTRCSLAGVTTTGVAVVYKINGGSQKQLLMAVQNADRSKGWLFSATQP